MKYSLLFFLILININISLIAKVIRIPDNYKTIQAGINIAAKGDTVLVIPGTYFENINFKGKAITLSGLYSLSKDSSHLQNTVINGSKNIHPDSGSVVYMISGEDSNSVLTGFTIQGGSGTDISQSLGFSARAGGGVLAFSGGTLRNNIIKKNKILNFFNCAGGAIFAGLNGKGLIILENNTIYNNELMASKQAVGGGVALFNINARIQKNTISNNWSSVSGTNTTNIVGGGIFCESMPHNINSVIINFNLIFNNSIESRTDNFPSYGAGISSWFTRVMIHNNKIFGNNINNTYSAFGAGVALTYCGIGSQVKNNNIYGNEIGSQSTGYGAVSIVFSKSILINKNEISYNKLRNGSGIFIFESTAVKVNSNWISNNIAGNNGGGIYAIESNPHISNNIIVRNKSVKGGGLNFFANSTKISKEIIALEDICDSFCSNKNHGYNNKSVTQIPVVINNTITDNTANYYGGGIFSHSVSPIVINSILWSNTAPSGSQFYNHNGNSQLHYCDVQDTLWPGIGNFTSDPLFADSLYNLSDMSPCIAAGFDSAEINDIWYFAPESDYDGDTRPSPKGSVPDIGAQEHLLGFNYIIRSTEIENPKTITLLENYPNPFNPKTNIQFKLSKPGFVTLKIYDIKGQKMATLIDKNLNDGNYKYEWDASVFAGGIYFCELRAGDYRQTKKLILLK